MAKVSCSKVSGLQRAIAERVNKALNNEVADYVKGKLKDQIEDDIYASYIPYVYERRMDNHGLLDDNNMPHDAKNCTLKVYERAPVDPPRLENHKEYNHLDGLARLLEEGPYDPWGSAHPDIWARPRKFMTNTQKEINKHNYQIRKMIKERVEHDD